MREITIDLTPYSPGTRVKRLRAIRGMTAKALSEKVKMNLVELQNFENGNRVRLYVSQASRVARALGVDMFELFGPEALREDNGKAKGK